VSDAGLAHLKALTQLTRLDLTSSQVKAKAGGDLVKAIPALKIKR
jgi:hypothetical protein